MKTEKNILIAFILNLGFSIFEFIGGLLTNSVSIISDAIHDVGDSLSIGLSYILEKKSKQKPNNQYTYGYARYSAIGSLITTVILITGSIFIIHSAIKRIIDPVEVNYDGMIVFAIIGVIVNFFAVYYTKEGNSLNQKSVNLHMIEDVLGWVTVLIGALIMKITDISTIDPILSILVALFILKNAIKNFKTILDLFLEKTPLGISPDHLKENLLKIDGIKDIHHIHVWSIDGYNNYATMHIVTDQNQTQIKKIAKEELKHHNISHATIEIEDINETCSENTCTPSHQEIHHHH